MAQPKINRRGWLALWAQDRRRLRQALNVPPVAPDNRITEEGERRVTEDGDGRIQD